MTAMPAAAIPEILTDRLRLRAPRIGDFDAVATFLGSERSRQIGGPMPRHKAWGSFLAQAGQWALRGYGMWLVADRGSDEALGRVGIYHPDSWPEAELGWTLFAAAEGRGIAAEAAVAARSHAAGAWGMTRLISTIRADNLRSIALAERLGCRLEGDWDSPWGRLGIWRHPEVAA